MKKSVKRVVAVITATAIAVTMLLSVPFLAAASSAPAAQNLESSLLNVWADPENVLTQDDVTAFNSGTKTALAGAVGIHKISSGSSYYMFLPSNADCTNLKFWFSSDTTVKIDGATLTSGQPTSVLSAINAGGISQSYSFTVGSSSYTVTAMKSGDVGAVYIDTNSGSISSINSSQDNSETGTIVVANPDGSVDYDGELAKMNGRGNASWNEVTGKKPYNIKLAESASLQGMPKAKKWSLIANDDGTDPSLLKNQIIYDFSDYIGIPYQVHSKPVDLYVNQQYFGCYQLTERVQIKSNRINITDAYENLEIANGTVDPATGLVIPKDLTGTSTNSVSSTNSGTVGQKEYSSSLASPSDYTGGYVYELEISQRWVEENAGFCAYNGQGWTIKNCDYVSKDMCDYSYDLLYALGGAVYNGGIVPSTSVSTTHKVKKTIFSSNETKTNPAPAAKYQGKKWSDLLDANSAVLFYWVQEYFQNLDASTTSNYFFKDSDSIDGKIYAGPIWDMDHAWYYNGSQSRWGYSCSNGQTWYAKNGAIYRWYPSDSSTGYTAGTGTSNMCRTFLGALCYNCSDFWPMVERYWFSKIQPATQILLGNATDETGKLKSVAEYASTIEKSGKMNNIRHAISAYSASSITNSLVGWVNTRNNWINSQISSKDISAVGIDPIDLQTFTGYEITPEPVVTYEGSALEKGVDYEVSYANNVNAGYDAQVIITGKGMFTGTTSTTFTIQKGTLSGGSASIMDGAYVGDTLSVDAQNADGSPVNNSYVTYQWKADGADIAGETGSEYVVKSGDEGKTITVSVKGDGTNLNYASITSNGCLVYEGTRPEGYSRTIAEWKYDYTANPDALVTADQTGETYYYTATGGEKADTAELRASVTATDNAKIKWSGTADLYANQTGTNSTDQAPVMGTSKTDGRAWGQYPYFETSVSTKGYEHIKLSALLGGTKKGPRSWKVEYSLNGSTYTSVTGSEYTITDNKSMEQAFNEVELPSDCDDKSRVYIRMTVCEDAAINGINTIVGQTSGDAAVNDIEITGVSLSIITSLDAPTVSTDSLYSGGKIFSTNGVTVTDNNGGADVFYSVDGGAPALYTEPFNPFDEDSQIGDTATVTAFAQFGEIVSDTTTYTVTYAGADVNSFNYEKYPQNETNATVFSTGGIYGESAKMTAYTDGSSQYPPLWNDKNGAFAVSPDDGAKWSADSGFTFEFSTVGFSDVKFSCKAYTTNSGPKSASLQYSLDKTNWTTVQSNAALPIELGEYMSLVSLPADCNNKKKVYIRLATTENSTYAGETLHNNLSKGNFYINDVVISANENGEDKMPYTNKSTDYFGTGAIKYVSPDGKAMRYTVTNEDNAIILSGSYPDSGIVITSATQFNAKSKGPYTVSVWTGDGDDISEVNTHAYYYKGETVTEFKYSDKKPFESYVSADGFSSLNTAGVNSGTLSMYPNAQTAAPLSYTETYGVKVAFAADNRFNATKNLDNPAGNGYWLIETSTEGYKDLSLNLEQLSSNKGPRDWGIAYSTNGSTFTYVPSSNARAISNDAAVSTVETYNNLPLPAACENKEHLYIKVFINGGETVDGEELDDELEVTKGNTGINAITLSGIAIPTDFELTVNTTMLESPDAVNASYPVDTTVSINGQSYETENGSLTFTASEGQTYTIVANSGKTFRHTVTYTANSQNAALTIPVVAIDFNNDGIVNAKDYARVIREYPNYIITCSQVVQNFLNVRDSEFEYQ